MPTALPAERRSNRDGTLSDLYRCNGGLQPSAAPVAALHWRHPRRVETGSREYDMVLTEPLPWRIFTPSKRPEIMPTPHKSARPIISGRLNLCCAQEAIFSACVLLPVCPGPSGPFRYAQRICVRNIQNEPSCAWIHCAPRWGGFLACEAAWRQAKGYALEELADWVTQHRLEVCRRFIRAYGPAPW